MRVRVLVLIVVALCLGLVTGCFSTDGDEKNLLQAANALEKEGKWDEVKVKIDELLKLNPKNVDGLLAQGRLYIAENDPKAAIISFNSALENDPRNAEAMLGLAKIYLAGKRVGDAQTQIDKLLSQDPKNKEARGLKAAALVLGGDMRGAEEAFSQILADDPGNAEALLGKFGIAMQGGRTEEGWKLLDTAIADNPDNIMLLERASLLYFREKQIDKAEKLLLHLIELKPDSTEYTMNLLEIYAASKNMDKAEALLRKSIAAHPQEDKYRNALVVLLFNSKRTDDAFALIKEVEKPSPALRLTNAQLLLLTGKRDEGVAALRGVADDSSDPEAAISAKIRLGMLLADSGDFDEADKLAASVLATAPDNADALKLQGKILYVREKFTEALTVLNKVREKYPNDGDTVLMLFRVYEALNRADDGADIVKAFVKAHPDFAQARVALADYYMSKNDADSAVEQLKGALENAPHNAELYLMLGDIEMSRKNTAKAKDYFESAGKQPNGSLPSLLRLGNLNLSTKNFGDAQKIFETAMKQFPNDPQPAEGKLLALLEQKKFKDAMDWVVKRANERDKDPAAQELASRVMMMAGKHKEAEAYLQKSMTLAPESLMPITRMVTFYLQVNRRSDAIKLLRDKMQTYPPLELTLAQVLGESKDAAERDEAEKIYRKVLEADPQSVVANNNLADLMVKTSNGDKTKLADARILAERAATRNDPIALDTLGWIQHLQGENDAALLSLGKASRLEPNTPVIIYHYSAALAASGKKDEARKMLKLLLEKFKNFPERKDAEALLKSL